MSKTKKQEKSSDTPEQSTKSEESVSTTETASKSSGGDSVDLSEFNCPVCGAKAKSFKGDSREHAHCGMCGTNLQWARTSPKYKPMFEAWASARFDKNVNYHEDTPLCGAKSFTWSRNRVYKLGYMTARESYTVVSVEPTTVARHLTMFPR